MKEDDAIAADPDAVSYLEAPPAPEFENMSSWEGIALDIPWTPNWGVATNLMGPYTKTRFFGLNGEVIHAVETFSIRSHQ